MGFLRSMALGAIVSVNLTTATLTNLNALTRSINQAQTGLAGLTTGAARMAGLALTQVSIASVAAGAGLAYAAEKSAEFEHAMQGVLSVGSMTTGELDAMRKTALQLGGGRTKFDPMEIASGMEEMRRAGFSVQQTIEGIGIMADVAAADEISMAEATDIVGNAFRAFDDGQLTLVRTGDILARASADTNTNISELGIAMSYAGPIARQLKIPLDDATAVIANMSQFALKGSKAGRGFASVIQRLAAPTDKATAELTKLGFSFAMTEDGGVDIIGTLTNLATAMKKVTNPVERVGIAKTLTGIDQAKAALTMLDQVLASTGNTRALRDSWTDIEGAAHQMAMTRLDSVIGQAIEVKNAFITTGIELMTAFGPTAKMALTGIKEALFQINDGLLGIGDTFLAFVGRGMLAAINDINGLFDRMVSLVTGLDATSRSAADGMRQLGFAIGYVGTVMIFLLAAIGPLAGMLALTLFFVSGLGEAALVAGAFMIGGLVAAAILLASAWVTAQALGMSFFEMMTGMLSQSNDLWVTFKANFLAALGPLENLYLPAVTIISATWSNIRDGIRDAAGWMSMLFTPEVMAEFGRAIGFLVRFGALLLHLGPAFAWIGSMIFKWFVVPIASAIMAVMVGLALFIAGIIDLIGTAVTTLVNNPVIKFGLERFGLDKVVGLDTAGMKADLDSIKDRVKKNVDDAMDLGAKGKGEQKTTGENAQPPTIEDKRCLHIDNQLKVDGREMAVAQKKHDVEFTERAGFDLTPWQRRQILDHGAQVLAR